MGVKRGKGEEQSSQGNQQMIDMDKQWNHTQTLHPPWGQEGLTDISPTNNPPFFKNTHIHIISLSPPLSLRDNCRVSHTSEPELAVASVLCQGKQS